MALKPRTDDPNHDKELKRFKKDPASFGQTSSPDRPKDWATTPLASERFDAEAAKKAEEEAAEAAKKAEEEAAAQAEAEKAAAAAKAAEEEDALLEALPGKNAEELEAIINDPLTSKVKDKAEELLKKLKKN